MDDTTAGGARELTFEVEASLLVNEGGVQCVPVVFARPLQENQPGDLGPELFLGNVPVVSVDPARAARRGPGLVAFVLEDPMDARRFRPGDVVTARSQRSTPAK